MSRSKKVKVAAVVVVLDECGTFKKKRKNRELWAKNWLVNRRSNSFALSRFILFE